MWSVERTPKGFGGGRRAERASHDVVGPSGGHCAAPSRGGGPTAGLSVSQQERKQRGIPRRRQWPRTSRAPGRNKPSHATRGRRPLFVEGRPPPRRRRQTRRCGGGGSRVTSPDSSRGRSRRRVPWARSAGASAQFLTARRRLLYARVIDAPRLTFNGPGSIRRPVNAQKLRRPPRIHSATNRGQLTFPRESRVGH